MTEENSPASSPPSRGRRTPLLPFAAAGLGAVLLLTLGYFLFPRPAEAPRPVVVIRSPGQGQQVSVGQEVTLHAVARGEQRIVRLELWVDGQLRQVERSGQPQGVSPLPLVTTWRPPTPGPHTLTARAVDSNGGRAYASVSLEASEVADQDRDRVPDSADECPDQPGWGTTQGCPDRDGDGIADAQDTCPDQAGTAVGEGCPMVATGDRDGDGVADAADRCPDQPGMPALDGCPLPADRDGDRIADAEDACPEEPGTPALDGCPDSDGDGIADSRDACPGEAGPTESGCPEASQGDQDGDGLPDGEDNCPSEPGPSENRGCPVSEGESGGPSGDASPEELGPTGSSGCPDGDGDGVCDGEDLCPGQAGASDRGGCPDTGAPDRDGDGLADEVDACPDEVGLVEHAGCPPPGEGEDSDGDGIPDEEEPTQFAPEPIPGFGLPEPTRPPASVELQVLEFEVSADYDEVTCYPSVAGGEVERYAFEPLGERRWDVGRLGSRRLSVPAGEPLELRMEAGGSVSYLGPAGGWGTYFPLGAFNASHPPSDWDGHVISARSTGGDDGRWFSTRYRLCAGSCEDAALPPPVLSLFHYGGDAQLVWMWEGERERIDGYWVYVDGSRAFRVPVGATSQSVLAYKPSCGSARREFSITAYSGDRESPPSNAVFWSGAPCPRVVRITFDALDTFHLGDDEWWADGESVGPIYGNFWAQGSSEERLDFFAVDYGEWAGQRERGFRLRHNHHYAIQDIFDQIWTWIVGVMSSPYRAPEGNDVTVELGAYEDLSIGGQIWNSNSGRGEAGADRLLFDGRLTLDSDDLVPGSYTIRDRNIELTVLVDVVVGPEAGDKPDLVVSDVTQHESSGVLRIHVFNNAADLVNKDIKVAFARVSTNEMLDTWTWPNVSIPSGGSRILQRDVVMEPWDLRVIVDPDNQIAEMNERNNTREMPVVMRVEFLGVRTSERGLSTNPAGWYPMACNEEDVKYCPESEHVFWLSAGHGPAGSDPVWEAYGVRYPTSGALIANAYEGCGHPSPIEAWSLEGNERYTFEFEMPAGENLYVRAVGEEQDRFSDNDSMGEVFQEYRPAANWGARSEPYAAFAGRESPCDDPLCVPCSRGLWASWRITRVH